MRQDEDIHTDIIQINPTVSRQDLPAGPNNNQKDPRSDSLKALVEKNIQYDPADRYPHPAFMRDELKKIYGTVQDKTEFSFARLGERVAKSFVLVAAGMVVVFTVIMLIIALAS